MRNPNSAARTAAAGIAALVALLSGCASSAPAATTAHSARPSATPTPTASPPTAPGPRVPTTCAGLVPESVVDRAFRVAVEPTTVTPSRNPAAYADERAGVLTCRWANGPIGGGAEPAGLVFGWVVVVPDVPRAAFDRTLAGGMFSEHETSSIAADTYTTCGPVTVQWCGFLSYSERYSVYGGVWDYGSPTLESQQNTIARLASASIPAVRALAPAPALWQPDGPGIRGATGCDQLLTVDQLASATGWSGVLEYRSDDGEDAQSTLEVNGQIGSYSCAWLADEQTSQAGASVLPGGAAFAIATRPADAVDVPGLGEAAFQTGTTIDVIADGAWLQLTATGPGITDEVRVALARQELANVGYAG